MTSRDVRDIMEVSSVPVAGPSNPMSSGPPPPGGIIKRQQKRPDGISRELYALIGDNSPSLSLSNLIVKPKFKEKVKRVGPNVKWQLTGFTIPSRSSTSTTNVSGNGKESEEKVKAAKEKLVLKHWVRDLPANHVDGTPDNKFLKFNTNSAPYSYTNEEYDTLLKDEDWTKEETDYLFNLAEEYDVRFIIMADRWDFKGTNRNVDDLKARYYSACRTLVKSRPTTDEALKLATISSLNFDKGRELERKSYLRSLLTRTPAQIAEEDFLYIESRRLEQSYNKITAERSELLKILGGREGIGASGGVQTGVGGGIKGVGTNSNREVAGPSGVVEVKKRKGQVGWDYEGLDGGGLPEGWAGEGSTRKATIAQDIANCIERHPAPSVSATKATPYPSVSVRSSRIAAPKPTVATKVAAALVELNISTHLIMPTRTNVEKLDNLQSTLTQLIELKKSVDRIEGELRMNRARKEGLTAIGEEEEEMIVEKMVTQGTELEKRNDATEAATRTKRSASVTSSTGTVSKRARRD